MVQPGAGGAALQPRGPSEVPALHSGGKRFNCISMSVSSENVLVPQQQPKEQQSAGCHEERPPHRAPWNQKNTENYKYIYSTNIYLTGKAAQKPAPSPLQSHDCFLFDAWEFPRCLFALCDLTAVFLSPMRWKGCRPNCSSCLASLSKFCVKGRTWLNKGMELHSFTLRIKKISTLIDSLFFAESNYKVYTAHIRKVVRLLTDWSPCGHLAP